MSSVPEPAPIPVGPKVWTTLLTNRAYLPGVLVLNYSLQQSQSKYPLLVLYTNDLPQKALDALDRRRIPRRRIERLTPKKHKECLHEPRFSETWSKIFPFSMIEYERIVLLDSDMQIMQNMDELMDLELDAPSLGGKGKRAIASTHACICNPLKKSHYPKDWIPESCAYTHQHSHPDSAQIEGASNKLSLGNLNSGLVVLNPSLALFDRLLDVLSDEAKTDSYLFPDQELLGDVFRGRWVALPYVYNALKNMKDPSVHGKIWKQERVKNIHYIFAPKPWNDSETQDEKGIHTFWHQCDVKRREEEKRLGIDDGF